MIKETYIGKEDAYIANGNTVNKIISYYNEVNQIKNKMENHVDTKKGTDMQNRYITDQRWCYVDTQEHDVVIIRKAHKVKRKKRQLRYKRQKWLETFLYFVKQKLIGLLLIGISIWLCCFDWLYDPITQTNDCTFLFITIPLGLMLLFSKERWIIDNKFSNDEWE